MAKKTYIIYKPFGMLSQFTKEFPSHITLADLDYEFDKDVYPIGRLDADSEGLLLLSNDRQMNAKILDPNNKKPKTYFVLVEGVPSDGDLRPLIDGITLKIKKKKHKTAPAKLELLDDIPNLPKRNPPVRYRKNIKDTWVSISITEGKNRQVRKMFAAIGFPVLRLVRVGIGGYWLGEGALEDMHVGEVKYLNL